MYFIFTSGKYIPSQPLHTFLIIFTIASQLCLTPGHEPGTEEEHVATCRTGWWGK